MLYEVITSFSIKEGEVVGLYGLVGAGRTEIAETIFGVRKKTAGSIEISGEQVSIKNAKTAMKNGVAFVTEDRKKQGLVLGFVITSYSIHYTKLYE